MEFVPIARLDEIPTDQARLFEGERVRALLVRVGGIVFALQARCPHKGCHWDGATLTGEILSCPECHFRYSVRTGLNPLTTACHVNQSTAEYHYRNFPEGKADLYDVCVEDGRVAVATSPRSFRKVIV
jgi:nitrite reductase/ring-hydroxylating ferredoxin subunit